MNKLLHRNLIFISGKGGVGKTAVSQAVALALSAQGKRTLWVCFEDPTRPMGEVVPRGPNLWHLNCEAARAFEEYAGLKIRVSGLTRIFVQNKVVRYLAQAAPGIHELVLLGKVWHDRTLYDHVVVDMPSTGYGLAMFQSTQNFSRLFGNGPLARDAKEMLETFNDPSATGQMIVSLPEEMPLRESLELDEFLRKLFPKNPPAFLVNKLFPKVTTAEEDSANPPDSWKSPFASSASDYAFKRSVLEGHNLRLWDEAGLRYEKVGLLPWAAGQTLESVAGHIRDQLIEGQVV